ncbi:MAG: hypothetical protein K8I82_13100 [Anaerolineae bacterium]|nr:hypothetical protein [Anaerolineae bacterium]
MIRYFFIGILFIGIFLSGCTPGLPSGAEDALRQAMSTLHQNQSYSIESTQIGKDSSNTYDEVICILVKVEGESSFTRHLAALRKGSTWQIGYNLIDLGVIFTRYGCDS